MDVELSDVRLIMKRLLDHLDSISSTGSVAVSRDFYWSIPSAQKYDQYAEPSSFDLGQLSDDWAELRRMLSGDRPIMSYHLVWVAEILRAIGDTVVA